MITVVTEGGEMFIFPGRYRSLLKLFLEYTQRKKIFNRKSILMKTAVGFQKDTACFTEEYSLEAN